MDYKKILEGVVNIINTTEKSDIGFINICTYIGENCPELVEGEDEKIRKELISFFTERAKHTEDSTFNGLSSKEILAWLEKQGTPAKLSEEEQNRFAKGVLTSCALSFIDYLDAHKYEGKMCVSNGECEDIENAFHNAMWDKLHRYYCKYIEKQGEKKPNPYSGTSFECNGHTWGMCARDNGVEILLDGELKAFLSLEKSFIYPIHPQPELAPKSALEAAKEEKVDNANKVEPKDYNDIDPHFGKPADKVEPKFHEGDIVKRKDNPHLTYILKRLTDDGDYEFHAIGKDGNEGCTCFAGVKYQDDWELVEQKPAWSEEDDRMMNDTLAVVDWYAGKHRNISVKVSNWLKLLKSRVLSLSLREFDKEEGSIIDHLIAICDDAMCYDTFAGCSKNDIEKYKSFLTNLKFGINPQPQTTWKPSDEQMKVLDVAIKSSHLTTAEYNGLVKLREQLKSL